MLPIETFSDIPTNCTKMFRKRILRPYTNQPRADLICSCNSTLYPNCGVMSGCGPKPLPVHHSYIAVYNAFGSLRSAEIF